MNKEIFEVNAVNTVAMETGEILSENPNTEIIVQDTPDYQIVKLPNGDFKKNMKYHPYASRVAQTPEEKIELYNVFNSDEESDLVTPMKNMIKKEITIKHVFIQPYEGFDEKTGNVKHGVVTTIEDVDGSYYVTSSKSVYYTIHNIMKTFGYPTDENYTPIKVKVTGKKQQNGVQIDLELVGIS